MKKYCVRICWSVLPGIISLILALLSFSNGWWNKLTDTIDVGTTGSGLLSPFIAIIIIIVVPLIFFTFLIEFLDDRFFKTGLKIWRKTTG